MEDDKNHKNTSISLSNSKRQDYLKKLKLIQKRLKFNNTTYFYACSYFDKIIKFNNLIHNIDVIALACILISGTIFKNTN